MGTPFRILVAAVAAAGVFLSLSGSAAALVTVGQTAPAGAVITPCELPEPGDEIQTEIASGASYAMPSAGQLTSWSTRVGDEVGEMLTLKVFRPVAADEFQVVAHDGPRPLTSQTLNTFPIDIAVQAGDLIGIEIPVGGVHSPCAFATGDPKDKIGAADGAAADGETESIVSELGLERLNVSAQLLPSPSITGISPSSGPLAGGTKMTISGTSFASIKSVTFGGVPGVSPTATSETQITVTAPRGTAPGNVPVTVTTDAGSATSAAGFTYLAPISGSSPPTPAPVPPLNPGAGPPACTVPKLVGKRLKAARKALMASGCGLGKVAQSHLAILATAKVISQSPKPGAVLPAGAKVNVKVR
jgi:IPT/TIG domain/PASTA domain